MHRYSEIEFAATCIYARREICRIDSYQVRGMQSTLNLLIQEAVRRTVKLHPLAADLAIGVLGLPQRRLGIAQLYEEVPTRMYLEGISQRTQA
jgi:hypothetical protein